MLCSVALVACRGGSRRTPQRTATREVEPGVLLRSDVAAEPRALGLAVVNGSIALVIDSPSTRIVVRTDGGASCTVAHEAASVLRFAANILDRVAMVSLRPAGDRTEISVESCGMNGPSDGARVLASPIATLRRAILDDRLVVAHAGERGPVELTSFVLEPGGFVASTVRIDEPDGLGRNVLAATLGDRGPAVVYRRGTPEDATGSVVVATERGVHAVEPLHDVAMIESLDRDADVVSVVASFEFERAREIRIDADGRVLDSRRLDRGAVRTTGATRPRADVEAEPGSVVVNIRDLAGDVIATRRFERSAGSALPVVVRDGDGFAVAWTTRTTNGWGVRLVRLTPGGVPR